MNNEDILITVKAYPNPSKRYLETVCVAGIIPNKGWIRLYPIRFRQLPNNLKFRKYEIINVNISNHRQDSRPESFRPEEYTIKMVDYLDTGNNRKWTKRKDIVLKHIDESMCDILKQQKVSKKSLGLFKPKEIIDFKIVKKDPRWSNAQNSVYNQMNLFEKPLQQIEDVPFSFKYKYLCYNDKCPGHEQILIDWEIFALYRNLRDKFKDDDDSIKENIKMKFLDQIFSPKRDSYFYTGNLAKFQKSFVLLGIFWPPK